MGTALPKFARKGASAVVTAEEPLSTPSAGGNGAPTDLVGDLLAGRPAGAGKIENLLDGFTTHSAEKVAKDLRDADVFDALGTPPGGSPGVSFEAGAVLLEKVEQGFITLAQKLHGMDARVGGLMDAHGVASLNTKKALQHAQETLDELKSLVGSMNTVAAPPVAAATPPASGHQIIASDGALNETLRQIAARLSAVPGEYSATELATRVRGRHPGYSIEQIVAAFAAAGFNVNGDIVKF